MTVNYTNRIKNNKETFLLIPDWMAFVKGITFNDMRLWAYLRRQSLEFHPSLAKIKRDLNIATATIQSGIVRLKNARLLETTHSERRGSVVLNYTTFDSVIRYDYRKDDHIYDLPNDSKEGYQDLAGGQNDSKAKVGTPYQELVGGGTNNWYGGVPEIGRGGYQKLVPNKINNKINNKIKREIKQNGTDELTSKPNDLNRPSPAGGSLALSDLKILDELGLGQANFAKGLKARKKKDQEPNPTFNDKDPKLEAYEPEKQKDDCYPSKDKKVKSETDSLPLDDFFPKHDSKDKKEGLSDKAKISNRPLSPIYNYKGGYEDEDLHFAYEWADWLDDIRNANGRHADIIDFAKSLSELRINYDYSIKDFEATKDLVCCNKFWVNKITTPSILLNKFNDDIACVIHLLNDIRKHEIEKNPFYYFDELQKEKEKGGPNNGKK